MKLFSEAVLVLVAVIPHIFGQDCLSRDYGNGGTVCVCNADHCDTIAQVQPAQENNFLKYTSNKEGLRFNLENGKFGHFPNSSAKRIVIQHEPLQTINGFGGAFTDSTGLNILSLDVKVQQKLLRSYFSKDGIEYSLCRVPMAATDFSTHPYTFHDEEDPTLSKFALAPEDYKLKIPIMRQALNLTNYNLEFFVSTWIAPKWMKVSGEYAGSNGYLKENMYQTWADYFVKFLDAYKKENLTFWGITTGNEPSSGLSSIPIPAVGWNSTEMRKWIKNNLGPAIRNSSHSNIKLMLLDDQRSFLPLFVEEVFENEDAKNYVDGIAVHFYTDQFVPPSRLDETYVKYPDKFILGTEACEGSMGPPHVLLGSWTRAENYASSIIEDMNHWVTGWTDWNMALDLTGGPTYISNFVDSPIIVNATAGEFYKQPMYYAIGHFSKFVPRGSVRINATQPDADVPVTAFKRPDNGVVLVILNKKNESFAAVIEDVQRGEIQLDLTNNSITTILYW